MSAICRKAVPRPNYATCSPCMEWSKRNIISDRETGRSRGFAFVEMVDWSKAQKAIAALNGSEFGDHTLNINEAKRQNVMPKQWHTTLWLRHGACS